MVTSWIKCLLWTRLWGHLSVPGIWTLKKQAGRDHQVCTPPLVHVTFYTWETQKARAPGPQTEGGSSVCPGLCSGQSPQAMEMSERPTCLSPPWPELLGASERKQLAAPPARPAGRQAGLLALRPGCVLWSVPPGLAGPQFLHCNLRVRLGQLTVPPFVLSWCRLERWRGGGSWSAREAQAGAHWSAMRGALASLL